MTEAMQVEIYRDVVARPVETYAGVTSTLHNVTCHKVIVVIVGGECDPTFEASVTRFKHQENGFAIVGHCTLFERCNHTGTAHVISVINYTWIYERLGMDSGDNLFLMPDINLYSDLTTHYVHGVTNTNRKDWNSRVIFKRSIQGQPELARVITLVIPM